MDELRLVHYRYLDPREAAVAVARPIARSVNIPFAELLERMHELPPKESTLLVAAEDSLASRVVQWLYAQGRQVEVAADFIYASNPAGERGRLWSPNAFLEEWLEPFSTPGRALDLACGSGREAVYLKAHGWQVTAVDRLPDALERGRGLENRYAPGSPPIEWLELDLEREQPAFEQSFDLIICFFYLHRPLLTYLQNWLAPGGSVLLETFTTLHRAWHGRPAGDKQVLRLGEVQTLLPELCMIHVSEAWRGEKHTARLFARNEMEGKMR